MICKILTCECSTHINTRSIDLSCKLNILSQHFQYCPSKYISISDFCTYLNTVVSTYNTTVKNRYLMQIQCD